MRYLSIRLKVFKILKDFNLAEALRWLCVACKFLTKIAQLKSYLKNDGWVERAMVKSYVYDNKQKYIQTN